MLSDVIIVEKAVKTFKDFWGRPKAEALKGVSLRVKSGSVTALLGPNGAGKSTLMKLLLGQLRLTSGMIRVLGERPESVNAKGRIGYLPENPVFWNSLTARETLMYAGRLQGLTVRECEKRTVQLLSMTGLSGAADRSAGAFSQGMRKRLGLALALLHDPELLILDEPTAGMDPVGSREVKALISTLRERGKTVLISSHLLSETSEISSDAIILYGGAVVAQGNLDALLTDENRTVIETGALDLETESALKIILAGKGHFSHPKERLEDYFLSVVTAARGSGRSTSGASAGSGVAEYLRKLEQSTLSPPPEIKVDRAALDALLSEPSAHVNRKALKLLTRHPPEQGVK